MPELLTLTTALETAVTKAALAPSVHNTQPWRFAINGDSLDLLADPTRQLAVLDPHGRQLHVSLGCALFNARVSLAAAGVGVQVTRFPDPARPKLVARLAVLDAKPADSDLAALEPMLAQRHSNRRRFESDLVPDAIVAAWLATAAAEGAVLQAVSNPDDRQALARLSQRADAALITNPAYRAELRAWMSAGPEGRDGVPAAAVPHVDGTSHDEIPIRDFDTHGAGALPADTRSSADQTLLILGSHLDEPASWLPAGEALERVWLELTRAGYVASLFTQVTEVPALRSLMRLELRLWMFPHLVLRVGRADATDATPRRPVSELLEPRTP